MPKKLDAITDVVKPAVAAETFDHYRITNLHFQQANPNGAGQLNVTITPCREDNGVCHFDHKNSVNVPILNPITEADANPTGVVQLFLDAAVNMVADKNSLVNAATV